MNATSKKLDKSNYSPDTIIIPDIGFDAELERQLGKTAKKMWTDTEIAMLTRYYGKVDTRIICQRLGRTHSSVSAKVLDLGLKYRRDEGKT
jgi:transcriptional regulator of aromatic amino acid metabolism